MRFMRITSGWARGFTAVCAALALSLATAAQQQQQPSSPSSLSSQQSLNSYVKPNSHLPNPVAPYTAHQVPAPNFANSARIDSVFKDGTMYLSLSDAVALALENNLDIAIARYNLPIADTDVLRAKAGSTTRGVSTGIVQGTPGGAGGSVTGAQGAGPGGTTAGAGGAGTGALGLVSTTLGVGANVPSFDPSLISTLQLEDAITPQSNTIFTGVSRLRQKSGIANFTYNQGFAPGTTMQLGFSNARQTTNSVNSVLNPVLNSSFRFAVSQPLLSGFGFGPNLRFIRIAKNNREISDIAFRLQVITTVAQIQNIYWDLVNAYEDLKVKQESLALAQRTLEDTKKQVQIGTLAPIETVRSQAEVSTRTQDLIVSQTNLQLQQLLMKNAISRNLTDALLASAPVIPTDTMRLPEVEPVIPTEDLVNEALSHRAELAESRIDLTNREINNKSARNALLPSLNLFAFYGAASLGGDQNLLGTCGQPNAPAAPRCIEPNTVTPTSYGSAFSNLFNSSAPDKGIGLSLNIPIRNRSAQADQIRAQLEYQQAQMRLQQQQNQIRIQVRNAQFALQQSRASVDAARSQVELARQSLDAEQKKYALGASTSTLVLQAQRDLAQAESALVAANTAYEKQRVQLDLVTGLTLTKNNIVLDEVVNGRVEHQPVVQDVVPRSDLQNLPVQPTGTAKPQPTAPITPAPQQNPPQPK